MKLSFDLAGSPAEFSWSSFSGAARLSVAGENVPLQSSLDPKSHYSKSLTRTWLHQVGGHEVEITKTRPQYLGGFRANAFDVRVDGRVVATAKGR